MNKNSAVFMAPDNKVDQYSYRLCQEKPCCCRLPTFREKWEVRKNDFLFSTRRTLCNL